MEKKLKIIMLTAVMVFSASVFCYAETYDFSNMTRTELEGIKATIDEEISQNHTATSAQKSAVEKAIKQFVEDEYGEDNVDWAWVDYSYTKEWDFYTMTTHADITKHDGGTAQYNVYGEVFASADVYQVAYVKIGEEELFNNRSTVIKDSRILTILGINPEENKQTDSLAEAENKEADSNESISETVIAKKGDKGDVVVTIQTMLTKLGYLSGSPDGSFGGGTEGAVIKFQTDHSLNADGIVTQSVYDKLKAVSDAAPEPEEVIPISAVDLYEQFDNNSIAAEAKFKGKTVQVTGKIGTISEDILGSPYVSLDADDFGLTSVQCYFSSDNKSQLAGLNTGQTITIKGTCGEMSLLCVLVKKCSIVG